ncbi:hypothetical protein V0M98_32755 (plasmid) [Pseudomonas silesiensis]|uniref:hypothetical protein n=1 Tax=Pseudomonas silesiensis TaxID=1853130 RepID=UPI0030CBBB6C
MNKSDTGLLNAEQLFSAYRSHLEKGDANQAMQYFEALFTRKDIERSPAFTHQYFVRPVLDDALMRQPVCADMVDSLELYAFRTLAQFGQGGQMYTQEEGLALNALGLKRIGQFIFIYCSEITLAQDSLVGVEKVFPKPFEVGELLTMYHSQATPGLIAPFCALYLSREGVQLPLNNPTSVSADRDLRFFGAKLTSAASLTGVSDVMAQYAQAPHSRKAALAVDLLSSLHENHREEMLLALRQQLGDELVEQAELTVGKSQLGKTDKNWHYPGHSEGLGL